MDKVKLIPYGISNFEQVRKENLYYIDKTMFLERIERAGNFLFLVRPRRFGKSVFLTMLQAYYDILRGDKFDELFGGLYVHDHPTPERAKYQVLYLDFSQIGGDSTTVQKNFEQYGCNVLDQFAVKYAQFYSEGFIAEVMGKPTFASKLTWICMTARPLGYQLYLMNADEDAVIADMKPWYNNYCFARDGGGISGTQLIIYQFIEYLTVVCIEIIVMHLNIILSKTYLPA